MPQFWCPSCHQFYSETGYCPFDGARLSIPPDAISHPVKAVSAHEELDAAAAALHHVDQQAAYDRLVGVTLDGRYLIERKIGEGGMGVVFAARHLVIERPLAVKVLKREVARDASTIKRFVQEAKAASRIGHPNIVDVTDFGTTPDGLTYSVMEYVDGKTLSAAIKLSAPFSADRALPIAAQIAQALGAAHDKGIVHRDLKPENVFLINRDGRRDFVKIVDFGIAKVTPMDASGVPVGQDGPRLTRAGAVFGTPEYMAPEQAAGRGDTDGRVDVYALGTILYEMLTGKVPHKSESMVRTLAMQMLDPIDPPSQVRPDLHIDPDVEAVVMKALAKKREQRYATMGEFLAALTAAAKGVELAQPVSTSVTAQKLAAGVLQPLPPGMASSPDATTVRPARESKPPPVSKPPPPLAPITATGDLQRHTNRSLHDPVFVASATQEPRITLDVPPEPTVPPAPPARRWPLMVLAVVVMGGLGVGAALLLRSSKSTAREPGPTDAAEARVDARTVIEYDLDGGVEAPTDARPPGPGPGPRPFRDASVPSLTVDAGRPAGRDAGVMGRTPDERGTVVIEVLTHPDGGILYEKTHYRGPAGVHVEEKKGTRMRLKCTLPGYQPGYVDLVFDGKTEVTICTMQRLPCVPGIKDPFQDCPE